MLLWVAMKTQKEKGGANVMDSCNRYYLHLHYCLDTVNVR